MEYTKKTDGGVCVIAMKGKFTFTDHSSFKALFQVFNDPKLNRVEFDMSEVEFVDSAALGLLLLAKDEVGKSQKDIYIVGPKGQVKKMFEISRFYDIFNIQ